MLTQPMRILAPGLCVALGLALAGSASANDSTATVAAGGLVLTKSPSIAMRSEDLFLSERQVRVRYSFENTSGADVTATVAFPMPDLTPDPDDVEGAPVDENGPANFLGFVTRVDGKPVKAQLEQKAVMAGVDRTVLLTALHIPLWPWAAATSSRLTRLPQAQRSQLLKLGLVAKGYDDAGNPDPKRLRPLWTLKTTYFWKQTFPAHQPISIEHRYGPIVGGWVATYWAGDQFTDPDIQRAMHRERADNCVDDQLIAAAHAAAARGKTLTSSYIKYVLVTGANWNGPIGRFRMTVDKGAPANLVSFCGQGVKKTGPTTFQVDYANFTPTRDVSVLILKGLQ